MYPYCTGMAYGNVLSCSDETKQIQPNSNALDILVKYKNHLEHKEDGKVKWLGDLERLKCFVFDLFGEGKWSSPGGSAKSFRNDLVVITWYGKKNSLLFQG